MTLMRIICLAVLSASPAFAQLNRTFENIFNDILINQLQLSPGAHGDHFREAATAASQQLTPALNSLIAGNISSFPNSATSVGVTFSFESGAPEKIRDALGPIFGEMATTLGRRKLNLGMNVSSLSMDQFRGLNTQDMRFTFTHVDVTNDGTLGESTNESDTIDVTMGMDVDATMYSFFATYGLTERFDISLAVPYVDISLQGTAVAEIDSYTFPFLGQANHNFNADPRNPQLSTQVPYNQSASGVGDISLRLKYNVFRSEHFGVGLLLDYRHDSGDEADYLGSGDTALRLTEVLSGGYQSFTWHMNVSYERRNAALDSDELEYTAGFNHKIRSGLAWSVEFLGDIDVNDSETIQLAPGSVTIFDRPRDIDDHDAEDMDHSDDVLVGIPRVVDLSNIPVRSNDNTLSGSLGVRYAPTDKLMLVADILFPLNDGGLRSDVVGTVGLSFNY